jgi:hypothetical protein
VGIGIVDSIRSRRKEFRSVSLRFRSHRKATAE